MFQAKSQWLEKLEPKVTVVLDIDDCLTTSYHRIHYSPESCSQWENFFRDKNLFIEIEFDGKDHDDRGPEQHWHLCHCVHPAVPAFIKALFAIQNVSVSFYSSGDKRRNIPFVEQLLRMSLGDLYWEKIRSAVKIFSKSDLEYSDFFKRKHPGRFEKSEYNACFHGIYKKDLLKIVLSEQELDWTVIIDDDYSYVIPDQAKNLLAIPELSERYYRGLPQRISRHNSGDLKNFWDTEDVHNFNNIFYAMGILLTALEEATTKKISLKEALFSIQYIDVKKDSTKTDLTLLDCYYLLQNKKYYYEIGLEYLKKYQADLRFFDEYWLINYKAIESDGMIHLLSNTAGMEMELVETDEDLKKKLSEGTAKPSEEIEKTQEEKFPKRSTRKKAEISSEDSEEIEKPVSKKQKIELSKSHGKSSAPTQFGHDYRTGAPSLLKSLDVDDESKNEADTRSKKQPRK